jgi:hypothetical protein
MFDDISIDELNKNVLLLAIYKRKEDETLNDVLLNLEETGAFNFKQGKKYLKELKNDQYVIDTALSFKGIEKAKQVELQFKI